MTPTQTGIGSLVTLACLWEATAAKPGNVHRGADFMDMTFADFVASSVALGPVFDGATTAPLGESILGAVTAMRRAAGTNTHLGAILLLAPLVKAARHPSAYWESAQRAIEQTDAQDARQVYAAIRLAQPGGLGRVAEADVAEEPSISLIDAMRLAADRDLIAKQYVNGFFEVKEVSAHIDCAIGKNAPLSEAIVHAHVQQMARCPDSLIARKCGPATATDSARRAERVIKAGEPGGADYNAALGDLDFWLRSDGHRRNPGATADLVTAAIFSLLALERIPSPCKFYETCHA